MPGTSKGVTIAEDHYPPQQHRSAILRNLRSSDHGQKLLHNGRQKRPPCESERTGEKWTIEQVQQSAKARH